MVGMHQSMVGMHQQPRKGMMKTFVIVAVLSVAISVQARGTEPNGVNRYSSRAALLPANVVKQTRATGTAAAGSLSGRYAFLSRRFGLVIANVRRLNPARYSSKAEFAGATGGTPTAPVK